MTTVLARVGSHQWLRLGTERGFHAFRIGVGIGRAPACWVVMRGGSLSEIEIPGDLSGYSTGCMGCMGCMGSLYGIARVAVAVREAVSGVNR